MSTSVITTFISQSKFFVNFIILFKMAEAEVSKTDSTTSIESWTVINDQNSSETDNYVVVSHSGEDLPKQAENKNKLALEEKEEEEEEEGRKDGSEEIRARRSQGYLSFEDYMRDRILAHDYGVNDLHSRILPKIKMRKGVRKCKAANIRIKSFLYLLLLLSGFTYFMTLAAVVVNSLVVHDGGNQGPQIVPTIGPVPPHHDTADKCNCVEFENLPEVFNNNLNIDCLPDGKGICNIFRNISEVDDQIPKNISANIPLQTNETPEALKSAHSTAEEIPLLDLDDDDEMNFLKEYPEFEHILKLLKPETNNTKFTKFKEYLLNTKLHAVISLIATNIYIMALLSDIATKMLNQGTKNTDGLTEQLVEVMSVDSATKSDEERKEKNLLEELPFYNAKKSKENLTPKPKTSKRKSKKSKKLQLKRTSEVDQPSKQNNYAVPSWSMFRPDTSFNFFKPLTPIKDESMDSGKSECEKRFAALDQDQNQFEKLRLNQRNRIRLLKQKFKNEVAHIKESEEQSFARADKINQTSQKFIKRMKYSREKYLLELKRIKDLKRRLLLQKISEEGSKDASVGNYTVTMPSAYNFQEKLELIRRKTEQNINDPEPMDWNIYQPN